MTFRSLLFWPHLVVGIVVGVVVFLLCLTGVVLTFERQMLAWDERRIAKLAPAGEPLPVGELLDRALANVDASRATGLTIRRDPAAPATLAMGRGARLLVDPYTGDALGDGASPTRSFMSSMRGLHRWLLLEGTGRATGQAITNAANLAFGFLLVTGLYLWFPRRMKWPSIRAVLTIRPSLRGKARDWNWHNALGFWAAAPLLVLIVSGAVIGYGWASDLVLKLAGTPAATTAPTMARAEGARAAGPRAEGTRGEGGRGSRAATAPASKPSAEAIDRAVRAAQVAVPDWQSMSLALPAGGGVFAFTLDTTDGGRPQHQRRVTVRGDGTVAKVESFADRDRGQRWRSILRFAHTGEVLGVGGQIVAGLASLVGCVLVYTGFALSWRRFFRRRRTPVVNARPAAVT